VRILKLIFILLIMLVGAAFAVMNSESVTLNYYFGSTQSPLSVIIVGAIALGALCGLLAAYGRILRQHHEIATLRRKIKLTSQEVNNLRAIPIKE
jgi:putative membrane protein